MSSGARTLGEVPGEGRERLRFYRLVRDALSHLYDPSYLQNHQLAKLIQPKPRRAEAGQALRDTLAESIESLRPVGPFAADAHALRRHRVLTLRYVEGLDADRVAELKRSGLLPAGNATDFGKQVYQSDTGELLMDVKARRFTVNTPRTQLVALPAGRTESELARPSVRGLRC